MRALYLHSHFIFALELINEYKYYSENQMILYIILKKFKNLIASKNLYSIMLLANGFVIAMMCVMHAIEPVLHLIKKTRDRCQ